jgi:RES domain-containing protein
LVPTTLTAWRVVAPGRDPLDSTASLAYVGRWHNPATTAALYAARVLETAVAEATAHLSSGPHALVAAQLDILAPAMLDLTDAAVAERLPFPLARCLADSALSPFRGALVGDAALALGATALTAPCRRGSGGCVCLFMIRPNTVRLIGTQAIEITTA